MLFGRQDAADWIELQITAKARTLVLSAHPLIGKTSFVKHVSTLHNLKAVSLIVSVSPLPASTAPPPDSPRRHAPDRENMEQISLDRVLQPLFEQLLPQLAGHNLLSAAQATAPFAPTTSTLRELLAQAESRLDEQPLILYIENLHLLVTADMALVATFLSAFMPILDQCPNLYLVFTANLDKLKRIRHPLLDGAPTFHLTTLPLDASANMITLPVKNILRFDYGITRRIAEINSHHPYYLCLFCHTLLNRQVHDGWVNQRDFDAALADILASPIGPFRQIWDESSWVERAVLAGMAAMQGKHGPMMQQEIIRFLQRQDSGVVAEVVVESLKTLAERGVLVPMGAVSYRFHVELLRFWLHEHTHSPEVLKEVDWARLAAQLKLSRKEDKAVQPPIASPRKPQRSGRSGFLWPVFFALLGALCVLTTGVVFAVQFLDLPLAFLATPTPIPTEGRAANVAIFATEVMTADDVATATPAGPPATATPTPALVVARTLPSITYMARDIGQSWRIYMMNADGTNEIVLSEDGFDDTAPIWSSDGRMIAFVSRRDGDREIYVMDVETKATFNITRHPADDWTPAWSPDGKQLAFSSLRDGGWEIYVVDTSCFQVPETCPDNLIQITNDGNANISPVWSTDGNRFAFNSKASGNWDIYTMAVDGSDIRQVTTAIENDLSPAWSPDGSRIAFESSREGNVEIYVTDSNGTTPPQNISNLSFSDDHGPTWSPDGQLIVFYSNREGNWDIFSTTLDGQTAVNLTQTPSRDEQTPAWRP